MKFTTALLVTLGIAGAHLVPDVNCAPKRGDSGTQVLKTCGKPKHMGQSTTAYGALREQFEYSNLSILLEDNLVIHVVKFAPAGERPL